VLAGPIAAWIPNLHGRTELVVLAVCNGVFSGMTHLYATIWQLLFRPRRYNLLFVGGSIASLAFTLVWFWWASAPHAVGPLAALTLANALTSVLGLWLLRSMLETRGWREISRSLLLVAIPLVPFSVASWVLTSVDRYFLSAMRAPAEVGLYAAAVRIAAICSVVFAPFQAAWYPRALASWSTPERDRVFSQAARGLLGLGGLFVAALGLASPLLIDLVVSGKYAGAERAASALIFASLFTGLMYIPLATIMAAGRSSRVSLAYLLAAAVSCGANFALVPLAGIGGASLTMIAAQATLVAALFAFASRSQSYALSPGRVVAALVAIMIVSVAVVTLRPHFTLWSYVAVAVLAWLALALVLNQLGWLDRASMLWLPRLVGMLR
jgi:O-antigen/teichoic acid export membrane protein